MDSLERSTLEDIYGLIHNRLNQGRDIEEWHTLSEDQRQGMLDAIKELESGNGIPHKKIVSTYKKKYAG